jgi:uncharacterized lipoprotein YmbA
MEREMKRILIIVAALGLTGCAQSTPAENTADLLENAADQSTPAAAEALDNAADSVRENGVTGTLSDPNGSVQNAIEEAANAQSSTPS